MARHVQKDVSPFTELPVDSGVLLKVLAERVSKDGRIIQPSVWLKIGDAVLFLVVLSLLVMEICALIYISGSQYAQTAKAIALWAFFIDAMLFAACILGAIIALLFKLRHLLRGPTANYADGFDANRRAEARLLSRLTRIPAADLESLSRRVKVESSIIKIRTGLVAIAGVAAASADKLLGGRVPWLPDWSVTQMGYALLMGSAIGAALLTSVMGKLDRLSFVLDEAAKRK